MGTMFADKNSEKRFTLRRPSRFPSVYTHSACDGRYTWLIHRKFGSIQNNFKRTKYSTHYIYFTTKSELQPNKVIKRQVQVFIFLCGKDMTC